jgi:ribonuclease HI
LTKSPAPKFYVVWKGRRTGVFTTWATCEAQVKGFTGARYKAYPTRAEAERAFHGTPPPPGKPASASRWLFTPDGPIADSYCVDAACSGSPGPLEYRGVVTKTGEEFFREGPFKNGTNNIGEFLAIVQALQWLQHRQITAPLYSDSATAIGWVRKKVCKTQLAPDRTNAPLFKLIHEAEAWLKRNTITTRLLKWDTRSWGEIPADFNRK